MMKKKGKTEKERKGNKITTNGNEVGRGRTKPITATRRKKRKRGEKKEKG